MRLAAGILLVLQLVGANLIAGEDERPFSNSLAKRGEEMRDKGAARQARSAAAIERWSEALVTDPANLSFHLRLARAFEDRGDFNEAIAVLSRALCLNPVNAATHDELGNCYRRSRRHTDAAAAYERAIWYDPRDLQARRRLADSLYDLGRYAAAGEVYRVIAEQRPNDFSANYWLGSSLFCADQFDAAAKSLVKAVELRPDDFDANFWCGNALLRVGRFREATAKLQHAVELPSSSEQAKNLLFFAALAGGEMSVAVRIYPVVVGIAAAVLNGFYFIALLALCWFSFRKSNAEFPPLSLSFGWLFVMFEGQMAALFLLALIPAFSGTSNSLLAILLPTIPIILAALFGFARQRWGEPFRWPLRLGGAKGIGSIIALLALNFLCVGAIQKVIAWSSGHPLPVQNTARLLREPLVAHPVLGLLAIVILIPIAEEIVFRGILYGALCRWMRASFATGASALLFACVHFDLAFFIPLALLGLVLGWARSRSGSLGLPIVAHCLNNAVAIFATISATPQ